MDPRRSLLRRRARCVLAALVATWGALGCVHQTTDVFDMGSGKYRITCEDSMKGCISEANYYCPDGYKKLDEGGEYVGSTTHSSSFGNGYGRSSVSRTRNTYGGVLVVRCVDKDSRHEEE